MSWKLDKVPLKSTHQTSVCLLIVFSIHSKSSIISPPIQNLLFEAKRSKERNQYRFCWAKNSIIYLLEEWGFPTKQRKLVVYGDLLRRPDIMSLKSCDLDPIPVFIMNCQFSDNQDYQPFSGIWSILSTDLKVASVKLWHCSRSNLWVLMNSRILGQFRSRVFCLN